VVDVAAIHAMLFGATVHSLGRAADMGVLELVGSRDEAISVHLQCPFRVRRSHAIIVGSRDMRFPQSGAGADAFDNFATVFDDRAERLTAVLGHRRPVVQDVLVSALGDLTITWPSDYSLDAFSDSSGRLEAWRVLTRGGEHHVFPQVEGM